MSHYKEINKELVDQVQNMKIQLNLYCNEIVFLKRDMMDKHESQVFLRKKCFNWAVENFKHLIETVEPECTLIDKIREYEPEIEKRPARNRNSYQRSHSLRSSNEDRRSSHLRMELQRSNNIIHSRRSMYSISPTRQSSATRSLESDMETDILQEGERTEEVEKETSVKQVNSDYVIFEESEDEVEELDKQSETEMAHEDTTNEKTATETLQHKNIASKNYETAEATEEEDCSQYESVEEIIDISHTRTTIEENHNEDVTEMSIDKSSTRLALNDLTNTHNSKKTTKKRKVGRPPKERTQNHTKHITSNEESQESTDSSPIIARNRLGRFKSLNNSTQKSVAMAKQLDKSRQTDIRPRSMDVDESIQQNRDIASLDKYNNERRKSMHMAEIITQEVTMATATSFAINDMTLQNFNTAVASSTPNSRRNSMQNATERSPSFDSTSLLTSTNSRPSRKCKPKVLVEPNLNSKMRNDTKGGILHATTKSGKYNVKKKK